MQGKVRATVVCGLLYSVFLFLIQDSIMILLSLLWDV